ncbi:lipid-A-disaccharide synthase N-terminal domain-containing protein [Rhodovulum sp. DZ06]|uniref:lipid-A-disaccharide synthase N-terminal domain-containing protein n=1 Tax=Rhodovulum sp. DZ06 TaxID=3425126 RepID=UPI003D329447
MIEWLMGVLGADSRAELAWVAVGLGGQLLFTARFLVQWIASEKARKSVVPTAFWWFSIGGAAVLLAYAIYRADPVFILGQSMGFFIYARNLWFIRDEKRAALAEAALGDGEGVMADPASLADPADVGAGKREG